MEFQLPLDDLKAPFGRVIPQAIADSLRGLHSGTEDFLSPDGKSRMRVVYHPGQMPDITFPSSRS